MPHDGHINDDTSGSADQPASAPATESAWIDLRTAEHHTGIPLSTLRRWHRRGAIPSRITETPEGPKVELDADAVSARAAERGLQVNLREAEPHDPPIPAPEPPSTVGRSVDPAGESAADPVRAPAFDSAAEAGSSMEPSAPSPGSGLPSESPAEPDAAREPAPAPAPAPPAEPDDAIIVPLDSWRRMLIQLGNLHETGQQLADAKERAARAETEASFLKERLADLRAELEAAKTSAPAPEPPAVPTNPPDAAATGAAPQSGSPSPAGAKTGTDENVPRTSAGRAVDQVIDLAVRTWKQRRGE